MATVAGGGAPSRRAVIAFSPPRAGSRTRERSRGARPLPGLRNFCARVDALVCPRNRAPRGHFAPRDAARRPHADAACHMPPCGSMGLKEGLWWRGGAGLHVPASRPCCPYPDSDAMRRCGDIISGGRHRDAVRNDPGTYVSPRVGDLRMVMARVDFLRHTIILFSYSAGGGFPVRCTTVGQGSEGTRHRAGATAYSAFLCSPSGSLAQD